MPKQRTGFHNATLQISLAAWRALCADAERKEESVTHVINELLNAHYRIPKSKIPAPKRTGRRPKKEK